MNSKLRDALNKRQKSFAIVERIGDILLEHVTQFAPFVSYGSHQLYGKYEFEKEKSNNLRFQKLVDVCDIITESIAYNGLTSRLLGNRTFTRVTETGAEWILDQACHAPCALPIAIGRCS